VRLGTLEAMSSRERRTVRLRFTPTLLLLALAAALLALVAAGCGRDEGDEGNGGGAGATAAEEQLSGNVLIDGSSTVGPLTTAAAESYRNEQPNVNIEVGVSGTGGGFERFCAGETDISNASRPIDEEEEVPICQDAGVEYTEFQVGVDALTLVVNPANDWVDCLTVDQLKTIWEPKAEGKVTNWNQVDPSFPDQELVLAGAGTDSGTFDYFTDEINGEEGASRTDYQASEDDNQTVQAVSGAEGGLGYFGFSYYEENQDTLKALEVDGGEGCVPPSVDTARDGSYAPLSRPLFIYVKNTSLQKPEVHGFVEYFLTNSIQLAEDALFIPVPDEQVDENLSTLESAGA
jgi:phosphate transport system substrate-binding protein